MVGDFMMSVVIAIIAFLLGNVTGYLLHDMLKKTFHMSDNASRNFLIVMVTMIWSISMLHYLLQTIVLAMLL
jgi:glycerol kinase